MYISKTLEEIALFEYRKSNTFGTIKGVDNNFHKVTGVDSTLQGEYLLNNEAANFAILGRGMRNKLGVSIDSPTDNILKVFMAKRKRSAKPFRERLAIPRGVFSIQPEYDNEYVLSSLDFARSLMNYEKEVSFLELKLNPAVDHVATLNQIKTILGSDFSVKDRYQQDEKFNKVMNVEKFITASVTGLILALFSFNMVGALWMVVMDKKKDISILKAMGASDKLVRNIFLNEGILLTFVGMGAGFALALFLYFIQKQFGVVPSPGFIVDAYPIEIRFWDFVGVAIVVFFVGLMASIFPALKAASIPAIVRED